MVKLIACIDSDWGIGKDGSMPWPKLKWDMKYFMEQTINQTVVVGRKTHDIIGDLPGRYTIVYHGQKYEILEMAGTNPLSSNTRQTIWIIGGQQVYETFLPYADEVHLTRILNRVYDCDRFFPKFNPLPQYLCEPIGFYCEDGIEFCIEKYIRILE
jgi:dihydrofolate reductase